jgi:hypothetical protein
MRKVMARSAARFAYQIVSKDDGPYLFVYLKSDTHKIGTNQPIPGAWIMISPFKSMDNTMTFELMETYYAVLRQPWEVTY